MRRALSRHRAFGRAAAITIVVSAGVPQAASGESLGGTVTVAGRPLGNARVALMAGSHRQASELGQATTDPSGGFSITYEKPAEGVLYVDATGDGALRLRSMVGDGGSVTVNELTTVATSYALAQFSDANGISGPSPGLENAAATTFNLADPSDGTAGGVVTNENNGANNETLATLHTLANLVSLCASPSGDCERLLRLATPVGGTAPPDTVQAMVNLARNPMLAPAALFTLARPVTLYQPALGTPPTAWILALLYTDTGLYASGRTAFDAKGNLWSGNNWAPGTRDPSTMATALSPVGSPIHGSPISGGGIKGPAWGTAVAGDGSVWFSNFGGDSMSSFTATGEPRSPDSGWTEGDLNHPQGVAVDQTGNVWIANNYGPESAPGQGNVVVYPGGDPSKALTITGGGLNHPFAVQIDGRGYAWVTNAGLGGAKLVDTRAAALIGKFGGSVTVIGPDFKPTANSPIESDSFKFPLALALDSKGNAWVPSFFGRTITEIAPEGTIAGEFRLPFPVEPWSVAVDGSDRAWIAGFTFPGVWLLCGETTSACPPGSSTGDLLSPRHGFRSKAIQHLTAVQIDQSGNVWLSNNWATLKAVGGTGVVELIGLATPVCTPLIGLPVKPSAAASCAIDASAPARVPTASSPTSDSGVALWAVVIAVAVAGAGLALRLVRRR